MLSRAPELTSERQGLPHSDDNSTGPNAPAPGGTSTSGNFNQESDNWLHDFYKECGREITLAYTTLNQMKNWAMLVLVPLLALVMNGHNGASPGGIAEVLGAALSYMISLRFLARAIHCYNNFIRWNKLQAAIMRVKLLPDPTQEPGTASAQLEHAIIEFYYKWRSPIPRPEQIASNLKLGFGLLIVLPFGLLVRAGYVHWTDPRVKGVLLFAGLGTVIEVVDFLRSPGFDVPLVAARRQLPAQTFPAASANVTYVALWLANLAISIAVAY
jgi:hypothetical protein